MIRRGDQGAFSCTAEVRGIDNFLMDIALGEKVDKIHELLRYCYESGLQFMKAMQSVGAHITTIGDSLAGPAVVSPRTYKEFAFPYEKKLSEELKKLNIGYSIHICGNTDNIFDQWIQTDADIFEIDHKTNFKKAREIIDICMPDSGFILSSGCLVGGTAPPDNMQALADSVKEFGVFK